jgi:glucose-1-phosphate cytidylyltransferase
MKVAILAGGMGTRLAEETEIRPKPMVEVGGWPILWHIMRHFDHYGFREFVIALGYKGDYIRRFFAEYYANASNVRVDLSLGVSVLH